MYKIKFLSIAVTLAIIASGIAYAEDWKVGEKWIYKHEGPRPHSNPPTTIKGDRLEFFQSSGFSRSLSQPLSGETAPAPPEAR